jgi:hypothetical protein
MTCISGFHPLTVVGVRGAEIVGNRPPKAIFKALKRAIDRQFRLPRAFGGENIADKRLKFRLAALQVIAKQSKSGIPIYSKFSALHLLLLWALTG